MIPSFSSGRDKRKGSETQSAEEAAAGSSRTTIVHFHLQQRYHWKNANYCQRHRKRTFMRNKTFTFGTCRLTHAKIHELDTL